MAIAAAPGRALDSAIHLFYLWLFTVEILNSPSYMHELRISDLIKGPEYGIIGAYQVNQAAHRVLAFVGECRGVCRARYCREASSHPKAQDSSLIVGTWPIAFHVAG